MEIKDLGRKLREERESQGLSLEKVQEETKISLSFLKALEEGSIDQLPHPVYAKGFLQNYAKFLGLDWQKFGKDFSRIYFAEDEYQQMEELPTALKQEKKERLMSYSVKASVAALAMVLIVGLGWFFYTSFWEEEHRLDSEHDAEIVQDSLDTKPENDLETGQIEVLTPDPSLLLSQTEMPGQENNSVMRVTEADLVAFTDNMAALDDVPEGPISVTIEAHEECWLRVTADEHSREHFLRAGESLDFEYSDSLRLRLGNAGGVSIIINGRPYQFEARSGEVMTLDFTSSPFAGN